MTIRPSVPRSASTLSALRTLTETIKMSAHRHLKSLGFECLPSYPGTGTPLASLGGFKEWPNPTQVDVMGWPVSVCHQWSKTGT